MAFNNPVKVVAPVTDNVPATIVLPVVSATVNLSVSTAIPPLAFNNPVTVVTPVTPKVLLSVVAPVTPKVPVTINLSSIVVVPSKESIVKLPEEVSISLSPEIPICILSIAAPPFASKKPVKVVELVTAKVSVTIKLSSIVVVPPKESIVKFPEEVSISLSPVIPILMLSISAPPFASNKLVKVVIPATVN